MAQTSDQNLIPVFSPAKSWALIRFAKLSPVDVIRTPKCAVAPRFRSAEVIEALGSVDSYTELLELMADGTAPLDPQALVEAARKAT